MSDLVFNPKKMGKQIINAAIEKHKTQQSDRVVEQVKFVMERVSVLDRIAQKTERRLQLCHDQLDAIESGKFTIDTYTAAIKYDDANLNIDWNTTEQW